ncbi:MAG: hypothetical protein AAF694_19765 [Bacteroidota bacterium]
MKEIKNYAVQMYGGPAGSEQGVRAKIFLFDSTNVTAGILSFYDAGFSIPKDKKVGISVRMAMYVNELHSIVDILRNEAPIYLLWQESEQRGILSTSQEPVGEGEL